VTIHLIRSPSVATLLRVFPRLSWYYSAVEYCRLFVEKWFHYSLFFGRPSKRFKLHSHATLILFRLDIDIIFRSVNMVLSNWHIFEAEKINVLEENGKRYSVSKIPAKSHTHRRKTNKGSKFVGQCYHHHHADENRTTTHHHLSASNPTSPFHILSLIIKKISGMSIPLITT